MMTLPTRAQARRMGPQQLGKILRYCPESDFYGLKEKELDQIGITSDERREIVKDILNKAYGNEEDIDFVGLAQPR